MAQNPRKSRRIPAAFFASAACRRGPGKPRRFAGHRGVALLNDALLRRLFRAGSGRIAQLVEQMTLNHRVPGSSPGAPTTQSSGPKLLRITRTYSARMGAFALSGRL